MSDDDKEVFVNHRMTIADREKFKRVAKYTGVNMTGQLRIWIRENYNKLPKEAK